MELDPNAKAKVNLPIKQLMLLIRPGERAKVDLPATLFKPKRKGMKNLWVQFLSRVLCVALYCDDFSAPEENNQVSLFVLF